MSVPLTTGRGAATDAGGRDRTASVCFAAASPLAGRFIGSFMARSFNVMRTPLFARSFDARFDDPGRTGDDPGLRSMRRCDGA